MIIKRLLRPAILHESDYIIEKPFTIYALQAYYVTFAILLFLEFLRGIQVIMGVDCMHQQFGLALVFRYIVGRPEMICICKVDKL